MIAKQRIRLPGGLIAGMLAAMALQAQQEKPVPQKDSAALYRTDALWHNKERELHYKPEGTDFVKVSGNRRFNRALYGTHTGFRVETGDLPEFALYMPGMGGNLQFILRKGEETKPLTAAAHIKTVYSPGAMRYEITDPWLGNTVLHIKVLALAAAEGMIIEARTQTLSPADRVSPDIVLSWKYGGASGKKFSRNGDIGADPESSFYLKPENCVGNEYTVSENSFRLSYAAGKRSLAGVFPGDAMVTNADTPEQGAATRQKAPLMEGRFEIDGNTPRYLAIYNPDKSAALNYKGLPAVFAAAEKARTTLAGRVKLVTPDPYINTLGGALAVAADGIWEDPTFLHGAVAWRMRLPAWRGAFAADPLGWHDRAERHFSSYALSQVTIPAEGPVVADTALHLARQLEKMGTAMFSNGYICRNPNGDIRPHHYDMNLGFVDQLLNHFNWTGDTAYVQKMWPLLERHIAWEKRNFDVDRDGLYDAYACIWASDALQYSGGGVTHSTAYNYRANRTMARLAALLGKPSGMYEAEADKISRAVQQQLWLKDKGWFAEYKDRGANGQTHPAAGVWTIYHAMDARLPDRFQAYQSLRYVDRYIPHIPVRAKGLDINGLELISTTNWQPYTWSVNNVALAENLHTSLAYWQGGRREKAFRLWRSALIESMYLSASPGNFQQLSFYDAMRGELYRDFADPIGIAARTLVEGLFGILPDALHDSLLIKPGLPREWDHASLSIPGINFSFQRTGLTDRYSIETALGKQLSLRLQLPVLREEVAAVTINGKPVQWDFMEGISYPLLRIYGTKEPSQEIIIRWKGKPLETIRYASSIAPEQAMRLSSSRAKIIRAYDPQGILTSAAIRSSKTLTAVVDAREDYPGFFVLLQQGKLRWWQAIDLSAEQQATGDQADKPASSPEQASPLPLSAYFNDKVTHIFREQYFSPRPAVPTLQLPVQGIGNWCYPLTSAVIDDSGLRARAGKENVYRLPDGLRFYTPSDTARNNIVFTSLWDNYPDSVTIPLQGRASYAYFLLAGTTNPMQSQLVNGQIIIRYTDGSHSALMLKNPETWWPIEQDYFEDGYAFHLKQPAPLRVRLKTGEAYRPPLTEEKYTSIKGYSNRGVEGGAATVLSLPLDPSRQLHSLVIKTCAREVVIGLMGLSLQLNNER